ncbi:MAG: GNAT family N-acetyltransferase [Thermoleophilaceae bacterium]
MNELTRIGPGDAALVTTFLETMPEGDRTFFKEPIDIDTVDRWCRESHNPRWLLIEDGKPAAMLSIIPGAAWSAHVGELRLVVSPEFRRRGIGRRLARFGLTEAVRLGLEKIVVEVVADKEGDIEMFTSIGFRPEALLADHIRDRGGEVHDLVVLCHEVGDVAASMDVLGLDRAVGLGADE